MRSFMVFVCGKAVVSLSTNCVQMAQSYTALSRRPRGHVEKWSAYARFTPLPYTNLSTSYFGFFNLLVPALYPLSTGPIRTTKRFN